MGHAQNEIQIVLAEITKADHQLSETFYFIRMSYIFAELKCFSILCDVFCQKRVTFSYCIANNYTHLHIKTNSPIWSLCHTSYTGLAAIMK